MCSQSTANQVQTLRGIAREGKTVLRAQMVRIGDTKRSTRMSSPKSRTEDVFIVRSIKEPLLEGNTTLDGTGAESSCL